MLLAVCEAQAGGPERARTLEAAAKTAELAAEHINRGRYAEAYRLLMQVRVPLEPTAAWNNLAGYASFKLGKAEPALKLLKRALDLEPDNEDYLLDVAEFLAWHEAHTALLEVFDVAIRRMPNSPRVQFGRAVAYILANRRDQATVQLEALLAGHPRFEPVYRALGECYEDAGNLAGMVELGRKLQAINPRNPQGWYLEGAGQLGAARRGEPGSTRAIEALQRAVALDPKFARAHFHLGRAYLEEGRTAPAEQHLKLTLQLDPDHARAHYVLGRLYQEQGKADLARAELAAHRKLKDENRNRGFRRLLITSRAP